GRRRRRPGEERRCAPGPDRAVEPPGLDPHRLSRMDPREGPFSAQAGGMTIRTATRGGAIAMGSVGMATVGGSVAVSAVLADAPLFTAQAIRYALASVLLLAMARAARVPIRAPRGAEWLWLLGVAAAG